MKAPALPVATARRRLGRLGGHSVRGIDWDVSWHGPARLGSVPASEATVQARSGLMAVHGRDEGRPRGLGLEVASVAAGLLASQGALAALVGRARGRCALGVETSVLDGALLLARHHLAAATCEEEWVPARPGPAAGPPFATSDGRWVEIETLDPEAWKAFWLRLGGGSLDLGWAWTLFRCRYYRGTCTLPPGFHELTAGWTLAEVEEAAAACQVSLAAVRDPAEAPDGRGPGEDLPVVEALRLEAGGRPHGRARPPPAGPLPLAGMRVVEATNRMQGPLAGLLLAMLGAEVVKVEPPGGDVGRMVPPLAGDTGSFFLCFNCGKQAVEIDLAHPPGREELVQLVADSDVFLHNLRPGRAEEWGLGPERTARANPRLVYARATGWGPGQNQERLGMEFLVQAHSGLASRLSAYGERPAPSRLLLCDAAGGLVTCEGVLAALWRRELTGEGQTVEGSLWAGAMAFQHHAGAEGREGPHRRSLDQPVATADGFVAVTAADDDASLLRLVDACGAPGRPPPEALARSMALRAGAAWERDLGEVGIPCAVVRTDPELGTLHKDPRLAPLFEVFDPPPPAPDRAVGVAIRAPSRRSRWRPPGPPWRFA
jgi:crotonobetainyl-CoA:carnitine CoA-transferase CaiB-like acyl-CoA transferase